MYQNTQLKRPKMHLQWQHTHCLPIHGSVMNDSIDCWCTVSLILISYYPALFSLHTIQPHSHCILSSLIIISYYPASFSFHTIQPHSHVILSSLILISYYPASFSFHTIQPHYHFILSSLILISYYPAAFLWARSHLATPAEFVESAFI